jgi:NitT/TauT family transport system substrate-binding protein
MAVRSRSQISLRPAYLLVASLVSIGLMVACAPAARPAAPSASSAPASAPSGPSQAAPASQASGQAASAPAAAPAAAQPAAPPAAPVKVRVAYSELTSAQTPNWVAQEAGIYAKQGLDTEQLYIQSAQTVAAVLAGEVEVALGGGAAAMASKLGGSDMVIFLALTNYYPYELFVASDINSAADLRGKVVGISRFGSSSDVATRLALNHLGLDADRDVTYIQVGSLAERMAAMRTGQLAAAVASPPYNTTLRRMGLRSILDLAKLGEPALNNVGFARATWLKENPTTAQAFVNGVIEGIHHAKTNREYSERVMAQYLKLDDVEAVSDSYDYYLGDNLTRLPELSVDAGRKFLETEGAKLPGSANARAEEFFDTTFLERARTSGIVERLYGSR